MSPAQEATVTGRAERPGPALSGDSVAAQEGEMISKGQPKGQRAIQGHHPSTCTAPSPSLSPPLPTPSDSDQMQCGCQEPDVLPLLGHLRMLGTRSAACSILLPATCAQTSQEPSAPEQGRHSARVSQRAI